MPILADARFDALVAHLNRQLALHAGACTEALLAHAIGMALTYLWECLHRPADS